MTRMLLKNDSDKKRIIHISCVSPPAGGVSIFLQRLKYYTDLLEEKLIYYVDVSGCNVKEKEKNGIYCINKLNVFSFLISIKPAYIIFHSNSVFHLVLNRLFMHKHKFIYFAHGESILKEKNKKGWRHKILSNAKYIVCPTDTIYSEVKKMFPHTEVKKISFVLLPNKIEPLNVPLLNQLRQKVDFVFSSYASSLATYEGVSIYGIDMLIEALYKLRKDGYNCGLVLLISVITDEKKYQGYVARIKELNLEEYFIILDQPIDEACRLYASTDVYLRPTNTDGNAFSIYEALYYGIPVLASDAVQRAEGCLTFRNRNLDCFVERMKYLIDNYDKIRESTKNLKITGNEKELIDFFHDIGRKSGEKFS